MNLIKRFLRWFSTPQSSTKINRQNFINVQIDAIGVGLANAAIPFLPVFLTRLSASTFQVSMLTTMPALTGLILAIPLGQFLQSRRSIVPWYSRARLLVFSCYGLTGLITLFVPEDISVAGILTIWALATVPQTIVNICFNVIMSLVAGPEGRFELMTHRWSILGFTNAISALIAGQFLDILPFPLNYQIVFIALSIGGLISFYFSSQLVLPETPPRPVVKVHSLKERVQNYTSLIWSEKPFVSFVLKRFIFLSGSALVAPILPIYFVRELQATDFSIALINIAGNVTVILGYFFWMRQTRVHGSMLVLIATTLGGSLYPILTGLTHPIYLIVLYAGLNGIFAAGLNLVFFDELMKRIPVEHSATFNAAAQSIQYMSSITAPMIATWLANQFGYSAALIIGGAVGLVGFALFLSEYLKAPERRKKTAAA